MSTTANGGPASVRHVVMTAAAVAAVLTLGLILYILVVPTRAALVLRWYLLFVGAIGVIVAIRVIAARYPVLWRSSADRAKDQPNLDELPQRIRAINRLVTRAGWDAAGFEPSCGRFCARSPRSGWRRIGRSTSTRTPRRREPFWESGSGRC